jgi:tRNA 2-thiouridine synthesizing protein E
MARPDPYAEAEGRSGMAALPDTDDEGYLVDPADWSEEVAERLARAEGIELGDLHRRVLRFMRAFFDEHQVAADARFVIRYLAEQEGFGARARARLFELFPYGYVRQACKIAGMRRPRAWSTG